MLFVLLNPKEDCFVKIKISLFIITKENVSLITCDYVIINLTLLNVDHLWWASFNLLCSSPATVASLRGRLVLLLLSCVFILSLKYLLRVINFVPWDHSNVPLSDIID